MITGSEPAEVLSSTTQGSAGTLSLYKLRYPLCGEEMLGKSGISFLVPASTALVRFPGKSPFIIPSYPGMGDGSCRSIKVAHFCVCGLCIIYCGYQMGYDRGGVFLGSCSVIQVGGWCGSSDEVERGSRSPKRTGTRWQCLVGNHCNSENTLY